MNRPSARSISPSLPFGRTKATIHVAAIFPWLLLFACTPAPGPDETRTVRPLLSRDADRHVPCAGDGMLCTRDGERVASLGVPPDRVGKAWQALERAEEESSTDLAVRLLRAELAERPDDPDLLNDYAAALMVAGAREGGEILWLEALESLEASRRRHPEHGGLLFNRALLLDTLGLHAVAAGAWREAILHLDGGWAAEASRAAYRLAVAREEREARSRDLRRSLEALDREAVRRHATENAQAVREEAEQRLLAWAASEPGEPGDPGDGAQLQAVRLAADVLAPYDSLLADVLRSLDEAPDADPVRRGLARWAEAKDAYETADFARAGEGFEEARALLASSGSPFAGVAELYVGICDRYLDRGERADAIFRRLWDGDPRHPSLRGRAAWMLGLAHDSADRHARARTWFERARRELERAGEQVNVAAVDLLIADDLEHVGQSSEAWRLRLPAIERLNRFAAPPRRFVAALLTAQDLALRLGRPHVAATLGEEVAARGMVASPTFEAFQALRMAGFYERLGLPAQASGQARRVTGLASEIEPPDVAAWLRAAAELVEIRRRVAGDPAGTEDQARRIAETARGLERNLLAVEALTVAGESARALGQPEEAARYLRDALRLSLAARQDLASGDAPRLLDLRRRAFELLVDVLALDLGRPGEALALSETWVSADGEPAEPVSAADPPVLAITVTSGGVHRWWIDEEGVEYAPAPVAGLASAVEGLVVAIELGDHEMAERLGRSLFGWLFGDFAADLSSRRGVIVRPDGILHRVPWAALVVPASGRPLGVDHGLAVAQRVARRPLPGAADASSAALVVAAPKADGWEPLTGALREAEDIATLYGEAKVLDGSAATREAVLGELASAEVLHVGAHGDIPRDLGRPRIVLADGPDGDAGFLDAEALGARDLSRLRLVVLGSCRSTVGPWSETGGALGLARVFASAGVPATVAARFDLDDEGAARMLVDFHRAIRDGAAPAEALRHSRHRAYEGGEGVALWAAFDLFLGG